MQAKFTTLLSTGSVLAENVRVIFGGEKMYMSINVGMAVFFLIIEDIWELSYCSPKAAHV